MAPPLCVPTLMRSYYVYVIELDAQVRKSRRFLDRNRMSNPLKPSFYVGSSTRTPDERFDQHKKGYKGNSYVRKFGVKLRPELFELYNPIPSRKDAVELEVYLAERLRSKGHGVWQG